MKMVFIAGMATLAFSAGQAHAQCATPMSQTVLQSALENNYACGTNGSESWDEYHNGGALSDYKKGPTDRVDPTVSVGSYTYGTDASNNGTIQYNYTGGPSFTYNVQSNGGTSYSFCPVGGGTTLNITIQPAHCY